MGEAEPVRFERDGAIATLIVDRPEARNALSKAVKEQLIEIFEGLAGDRELRVLVIRGGGGKYISGGDISEFKSMKTAEDFVAGERQMDRLYTAIETLPFATVAVIEGFAVGGGLTLALSCDLRLCTPDARIGYPIAKTVGNCLAPHEYRRLMAVLGSARVKELIFYAELIPAERAREWGLVSEIVEREALEARLAELTVQLAGNAPLTLWATKESVRRLRDEGELSTEIMERVMGSHDAAEGIQAFLEKRTPEWRNE